MEAIRTLVVGMGRKGRKWARIVSAREDFELAGLVDIKPEVARAARNALALEVPIFPSLSEAIEGMNAEAAVVAVPVGARATICREALAKGLHLLVEVPFVADLADAVELTEWARRRGLTICVAQSLRYQPAMRTLRRVLREGEAGRPLYSLFTSLRLGEEGSRGGLDNPWLASEVAHHLDAMRFVLGREPMRCRATELRFLDGEAVTTALVEFDGLTGAYFGSTHSHREREEWQIEGEEGTLIWSGRRLYLRRRGSEEDEELRPDPGPEAEDILLTQFRQAVREGIPSEASGDDNLSTLALIFACAKSSTEGCAVSPNEVLEEARERAMPRLEGRR